VELESVWKPLTQSSGYRPRVTTKEKVLTADRTLEVRAVFPLCPRCLLEWKPRLWDPMLTHIIFRRLCWDCGPQHCSKL